MQVVGRPAARSVHRGATGRCIELRKHPLAAADLVLARGRQSRCRTIEASPTTPPRSLRPPARLETFLTEAERPRRHPPLPWGRIGRRRRDATRPTSTSPESSDFPLTIGCLQRLRRHGVPANSMKTSEKRTRIGSGPERHCRMAGNDLRRSAESARISLGANRRRGVRADFEKNPHAVRTRPMVSKAPIADFSLDNWGIWPKNPISGVPDGW